jgi:general secretion pathway protein D
MKTVALFTVLVLSMLMNPVLTLPALAETERNMNAAAHSDGITFNFVDVEIPSVVKFISEITGYNFIFDERIRGKVTIIAPTRLSVDESFSLFTSVLSIKGYTIIPSGPQSFKIIPSSMAKQEGIIPSDEQMMVNERYMMKIIPTEHIKTEDTLQFLRPIISRDGHISAFGPGNMLLVVDSAVNIEKVMSILKLIDKPSIMEEAASINVYFLEHADAEDLAKVMQGIIKNLQASLKSAPRAAKGAAPASPPVLSVTPEKATNSLIVVAPPADYENIVRVIKTLDKKRKQVYVEAMIVEAQIEKLQDLGTRWRAIARHEGEPVTIGGFGNINSSTVLDIIGGLSGFSVGGLGNFLDIPVSAVGPDGTITSQTLTSPGFAALFSLEEFKGTINVLSTPQILTSDNEEAEIFVGENSPFISQRERDVTTTNTVLNAIERTDVGIKLKITPQITEGDYVKLNILQEISAVKAASDEILISVGPTTTKRATKTSVIVKNGKTVVIGGLMEEREDEGVTKIPLLGDIPLLGWLFKFKSVTRTKTNLLVFLTPHVVKESSEMEKITEEKHDSFAKDEQFYARYELLVKFRDHVSKRRAEEIIAQRGASVITYLKALNVYHIKITSRMDVEEAVSTFSSLPEILYAEPNYKFKIQSTPSDDTRYNHTQSSPSLELNKNEIEIQNSTSFFPAGIDKKKLNASDNTSHTDTAAPENTSDSTGILPRSNTFPSVNIDEPERTKTGRDPAPSPTVGIPRVITETKGAVKSKDLMSTFDVIPGLVQ